MTDTRKTQLEVGLDASGVKQGANEAKVAVRDLARDVGQSAQQTAKAVDSMGAGADGAAKKLDGATRSIISSVQRATAAIEAGEKGSARYFETLASQRGANVGALKPYLDQLEEARRRADAAAGSVGRMGVSAAQTAAALRGVPAQFTDIFTSLASGQQPITVLLQQGGQLKDMFGGVGAAARALGGYVVGLINPFTLAAAAAGGLAVAFYQVEAESSALNKQLVLSGNAAGVTAGQLTAMAAAVESAAGNQGKAAEVLGLLAATGRVAQEQMIGAADAIIRLNKLGGIAVEDLVKDFAELGKSPSEGIAKLNEKYNFLTSATYAQIKALEEQGKKQEAASLAQETYRVAVDNMATGVGKSLGTVERWWNNLTSAAARYWDQSKRALSGGGSEVEGLLQSAAFNRQRAAEAEANGRGAGAMGQDYAGAARRYRERAEQQEAEARRLQGLAAAEGKAAQQRAAAQLQESERIAAQKKWSEDSERYLSREAKLRADIDKIRRDGAKAGATEAEIQQRIAFITEQLNQKSAQAAKRAETAAETARKNAQNDLAALQVRQQAAELDLQLMRERGVSVSQLNEGERKALEIQAELKTITDARTRSIKEQELASANKLAQTLKEREALVELLRAQKEFEGARDRDEKAAEASVAQMEARAQAMADEVAAFGLGKDAIEALVIARMEERKAILEGFAGSEAEVARIEREIAARKELAKQIASRDVLEANAKAAKDAQQEWQRAANEIERSITDSLMRGFESGKGFAETLRDTVVSMFKTMVLRPVVQAVVQPVASALTGGFGSAGGGGAGGLLGGLQNIFSLTSGGGMGSLANVIGGAGSMFGIEALSSFAAGMKGATLAAGLAGPTTAGATGAMGLGSSLAAAGPYMAAAAAAYAALNALGAFKGATYHTGSAIGFNSDGSNTGRLGVKQTFMDQRVWGGFTEVDKRGGAIYADPLTSIGSAIVGAINSTLQTFGSTNKVSAFAAFGADGDDASEGVLRVYGANGQVLAGNSRRKYAKNPQQGFQEYLAEAGRVARDALINAGIPEWARSILANLGASPELTAVTQAVAQINQTQAAIKALGKTFAQLSTLSNEATGSLLSLFGGIENLVSATSAYADLYYSDIEKARKTAAQMTEALQSVGLSLPSTKDGFRSLVESLDLGTESGRKAYATLMQLAPGFSSLADAMADLGAGIESEIERIKGLSAEQLGGGFADLQARFAVTTAQARAGDKTAVDALPKISQALLAAAENSVSTSIELQAIRASTQASLEATLAAVRALAVPGFAMGGDFGGGWRIVGERGPELEATGAARIFDAQDTARIFSSRGGNEQLMRELLAEIKGTRQDQRAQSAAVVSYMGRVAQILQSVSQDGTALTVTTAS